MVIDSSRLMFSKGGRLSVSAYVLSILVICWMLGTNPLSMGHYRITLLDALIFPCRPDFYGQRIRLFRIRTGFLGTVQYIRRLREVSYLL